MASEEELEKLLDKIMVIFRYKNIHKYASRGGPKSAKISIELIGEFNERS